MSLGLRDSAARSGSRRLAQALVVLLVMLASMPLLPATAVAEPVINVEVGYGGRHRLGTDLLVQVEVVADRLIDGQLTIASQNVQAPLEVVVPVEIAGGARKLFVAVVPSPSLGTRLDVSLIEGGSVIASRAANLQNAGEDELVGVLPSLTANMPAAAELAVPLGDARLFPIDDALLSAGPGAIDALGSIIGSAPDFAQLSEPARVSLETWLRRGGQLIVDEAPGPVPGFGVSTSDRPTVSGAGSLVASDGVFALGEWDGAIRPSQLRSSLQGDGGLLAELTGEVAWFGGPLSNSLAQDAGFGLPALRVVLPFMGLYMLIVGPLTFIILRRIGRSQLLWRALPAIALAFTAAVWISGTTLRSNTSDAHGTLILIEDGTANVQSTILRSSRNGGTTGITLPSPWQPMQTADFQFGGPSTGNVVSVRRTLEATRIQADLDAGEFALFGGAGPEPRFDNALSATAVSLENGRIAGTVTNQLDVRLDEVAVFTAFLGINIGSIGPSETISFELSGPDRDPRFGEPLEIRVWPAATQGRFGGPFDAPQAADSPVNIELWSRFVGQNIGRVRQQGSITVVGWTNQLASPLDDNITSGRTGVVLRQRVETNGPSMTDLSGNRVLLRGPDQRNFQPGFGPGFSVPSSWRLDIDNGVDPTVVALELPDSLTSIELWNGERWLELESPTAGLYALPPGAFVDGSVYAKPVVDFERSPMLGRSFSLQTVGETVALRNDLIAAEAQS